MVGFRYFYDGSLYNVGSNGYYWSSTVSTTDAYFLGFYSGGVNPAGGNNRANGFPVRCLKNCQLHKETEWEDRERVGEKPFNKTEKAVKEERKRIGEEFKKWFDGEGDEDIEDTIERICGVKC